MGRTCGEPDEIKKNTHPKMFTALFREQARAQREARARRGLANSHTGGGGGGGGGGGEALRAAVKRLPRRRRRLDGDTLERRGINADVFGAMGAVRTRNTASRKRRGNDYGYKVCNTGCKQ